MRKRKMRGKMLFMRVWRRHWRVWRKTAVSSMVGSFGEPLLFILGMGYGLGALIGRVAGMDYLTFVATGILASSSMNTATFESLYGAFTRMTRQNTFHAMLATPLLVVDVVAGEVVWAATRALISGGAIFLVGWLMGAFQGEWVWLALPLVFFSGLVFSSLAMVMTALSPSYEFFMYYFTLVTTPMLLFCGVFYPVANLPPWGRELVAFLPLTHVVGLVRGVAAGGAWTGHGGSLLFLAGVGGVAFLLAVRLVARRILV